MKKLSGLLVAGALGMAFAVPAFAGSAGVSTSEAQKPDTATIAALQEAAGKALAEGRAGNKNHAEFQLKAQQLNQLVDRLKAGEQVDPSEIDKALVPVEVW